ncbi:MAG: hypothetical protein ACOVT5_09655 [Armatimonadaceae bacterium]
MRHIASYVVGSLLVATIGCSPDPVQKTIDPPMETAQSQPEYTPQPSVPMPEPAPVVTKMETAPNGVAWSQSSGYVRGYPKKNYGGRSTLTIDNAGTDNSFFVKLVDIADGQPRGVRYLKVNPNDSFTMDELRPSNYEIRYLNINDRRAYRSEPFSIDENTVETVNGTSTSYTTARITLYTVPGGNTRMTEIREEDF